MKFQPVLISNEHLPAMGAPMMGTLHGNDFVKRVFHFMIEEWVEGGMMMMMNFFLDRGPLRIVTCLVRILLLEVLVV